jgi:hypothetical protein
MRNRTVALRNSQYPWLNSHGGPVTLAPYAPARPRSTSEQLIINNVMHYYSAVVLILRASVHHCNVRITSSAAAAPELNPRSGRRERGGSAFQGLLAR